MRIFRFLIFLCLALLCFSIPVQASEAEIYEKTGADALLDALPEETRDLLLSAELTPKEAAPDSINQFLNELSESVSTQLTAPLRSAILLLCTILLCRIVQEFAPDALQYTVNLCGSLCASVILLAPFAELLGQTSSVIQALSGFLLAAVPVYTGVLVLSGSAVTGSTYGALTLAAANGISALSAEILIPMTRIFLALSAVSAATSFDLKRLTGALYKGTKWALTLAVTIFTGILSIQTLVSAQSDAVTGKAAKLIASSAVPIVGSAFGDALSVLGTSIGIVKSGIGAFGILASVAVFLPICLQIIVWILICNLSVFAAELFGVRSLASFLDGCASALKILIAVVFSIGAVSMISAAIVLCVRGAYG